MSASIKRLSEVCGISPSAVSKALNGYPDISEETRKKVLEATRAYGYQPSAIARGLKTGHTYNIGVLYNEISGAGLSHGYFSPVLEAFKAEAERWGYDITFLSRSLQARKNAALTYLQHSVYRNVDGVCIVCCNFEDPEVQELAQSDLPVVTIDRPFPGRCCVMSENASGMRELTEYVISRGHRRIAYIYGQNAQVTRERIQSFRDAMAAAGLPVPEEYLINCPYHNPNPTREAVSALLRMPGRPTCILMPDDFAAIGGMDAAVAAGLRIPEDLSIAGFDGIPIMQLRRPCLTTVAQETAQIGREAAHQLIRSIEKPGRGAPEMVRIPTRLLRGDSVADAPGNA